MLRTYGSVCLVLFTSFASDTAAGVVCLPCHRRTKKWWNWWVFLAPSGGRPSRSGSQAGSASSAGNGEDFPFFKAPRPFPSTLDLPVVIAGIQGGLIGRLGYLDGERTRREFCELERLALGDAACPAFQPNRIFQQGSRLSQVSPSRFKPRKREACICSRSTACVLYSRTVHRRSMPTLIHAFPSNSY